MMDWQPKYDEELAELLTLEAERQKPPEPIKRTTYWLEAGILFGICVGILCWWMR